MTSGFSPTEIFKRATASTLRAIAERDDLTVGFGPEPAGVAGTRVKLPNPARDLPADEAAQLRGAADSLALRLRYHDDAVHSKRVPGNALARAVSKGSNRRGSRRWARGRMVGVACQFERDARRAVSPQGYERITERTEGTMAEAVRLLTREALTREPPPPSARRVVDLWRPWLEGKIGKDIGELERTVSDQDSLPARPAGLIQDLDLDLANSTNPRRTTTRGEGEEAEGDNQSEQRRERLAGLSPRWTVRRPTALDGDAEEDGGRRGRR
jgi:cobaltochelatase CobT